MEKLLTKLAALVDVKSLVTLAFTLTFVVLAITGVITGQDFMTTFLVIITYYFSKKSDETKPAN